MEYKLIRVYPYTDPQATEVKQALADGWQLHGSPFKGRGEEEFFQAVTRSTKLKEPVSRG